jgi:hypothetical protein
MKLTNVLPMMVGFDISENIKATKNIKIGTTTNAVNRNLISLG